MLSTRRFTPEQWRAAHTLTDDEVSHEGWAEGPWDPELVYGRFAPRSTARARLWVPVLISLALQVPGAIVTWDRANLAFELRDTGVHLLLNVLVALIGPLVLIGARRWPGPVVAIVALAAAVEFLRAGGNDGPPYAALAFAIGSAIMRGARVWAWISIAIAWIGSIALSMFVGIAYQPIRILGITIGILIVMGLSEALRGRQEHLLQLRATLSRRRQSEVQAERVRIARELHDVLAHSLSQINVQAGVGLHLMHKQPEQAAAALASIKETSKSALDEVRSVLGVLRAEAGTDPNAPLVPEPDLSRLDGLAATVIAQGVAVTLDNHLTEVPQAVQLALYRIVQESLTNVVRHAHASRAAVRLVSDERHYVVTIDDDGTGLVAGSPHGRGLLGMSERAELLGGTLTVSTGPTGGLMITARIPMKEMD
ncbi:MAG: sensor histidine kinase [Microbacteriaceae bacterium]